MGAVAFTIEERRAVVRSVASDWARLAVRTAGQPAYINNPYRGMGWSKPERRKRVHADNARRVALRRALEKLLGVTPIDPDTESFLRPDPHYGNRLAFIHHYAAQEQSRLVSWVMERCP